MAANDTTVTVSAPFQINHAGTVYGPGDTITASTTDADHWIICGWAEAADTAPSAAKDTTSGI